jgi:hypothetical protein
MVQDIVATSQAFQIVVSIQQTLSSTTVSTRSTNFRASLYEQITPGGRRGRLTKAKAKVQIPPQALVHRQQVSHCSQSAFVLDRHQNVS